jgi:hypothetical protein
MSIHNRRGRRVVLVYNPEAGPQPLPLPVSGRAAGGAAANNPEWLAAVSDYLRERAPQAEILRPPRSRRPGRRPTRRRRAARPW